MKVLLVGANGQLGTDLLTALQRRSAEVIPITHSDLEICNSEQVSSLVDSLLPDVVVNTAAFHKVEECEKQSQRAFQVNALAVQNLAQCCGLRRAHLVHFSTDYVFDGSKSSPYEESDLARPLNVYGVSKLAGEHLLASTNARHLIIRTSGLYGVVGSSGKGGNFVELMLKLAGQDETIRVVDDQFLTPTYTVDLAERVTQLIVDRVCGLYHISNEGQASWYEFARAIFTFQGMKINVVAVKTRDFPGSVTRPAYSVLSKERLYSQGTPRMPHWEDALRRYLQEHNQRRGPRKGKPLDV